MILRDITFSYDKKPIYDRFRLEIPDSKITCVLGPSGCGKTTLLNIIGGILPYAGDVEGSGRIAYIFQQPCLIPSLTVRKNVEFVLKSQIKDKKKRKDVAEKNLRSVGLSDAIDLYPAKLSGGMAQRASLARAFAYPADVLLMDEPFKELDISLKKQIYKLFTDLYAQRPITTVFVTHDIEESLVFGDKIVVLKEGKITGEFFNDKSLPFDHAARSELKEKIDSLI